MDSTVFYLQKLLTFLSAWKQLPIDHLDVLVHFLDPVVSTLQTPTYQQISPAWQSANFLLPVLYLGAILLIYGNLPLIYHYCTSSLNRQFLSRPSRQQLQYYPAALYPQQVWPQSEVIALLAIGISAAVLLTFVNNGNSWFKTAGRYELVKLPSNSKVSGHLSLNGKSV